MMDWEEMTEAQKAAAKTIAETGPLAFTRVWFQLTQGEKLHVNWHHRYFELAAQRMISREAPNQIINVPPGGTKTEFWSVHLPAYCFAKFKRVRILNTSFSKSLVEENAERTRALVKSEEWQSLYHHIIGKDKIDDWTIDRLGHRMHQLFSRPSGGQITGVRGGYMTPHFSGYLMMDDWDKPEDMFSETKRKGSHRRASNTLRSRRANDRTPVIGVQQRLHVNDITAFLLGGGLGMKFEQIKIPALINQDYIDQLPSGIRDHCWRDLKDTPQVNGYWSYFPVKESVYDLMALWESDPYTFMSQYMQSPEELTGGVFQIDKFGFYGPDEADEEQPDRFEYRFITGDTAQKTREHNDYSVFCEWGVYQGRLYLIDMIRGKWEAPQLRQQFLGFLAQAAARARGPWGTCRSAYVEDKSSGTGLIQEVKAKSPISIRPVQRNRDKFTRAMDVAPAVADGLVLLPTGRSWVPEFVAEVGSFSADDTHKFDDQTDNLIDAVDIAILSQYKGKKMGAFTGRRD